MKNKLDKNFIKQIIIIFFAILAANYVVHFCSGAFSQKEYQKYYHSLEKEVEMYNNPKVKKDLFNKFPKQIDISTYPTKIDKNKINKEVSEKYENIQNILKKTIHSEKANQFFLDKYVITDYNKDMIYYDTDGNIKLVEKGNDKYKYRYNSDGEFVEAELIIEKRTHNASIDTKIIYDTNQEIKYYVIDYISYGWSEQSLDVVPTMITHIDYEEYITSTNVLIIINSLFIWLIVIFCYIKLKTKFMINKHKVYNRNWFISLYNNIQSTKIHIWSHLLAFMGWIYLIYTSAQHFNIINNNELKLISEPLLFILVFYIESIFFPDFRIKWKFIYKNKIYCFIWNIGIILFIITFFNTIGKK